MPVPSWANNHCSKMCSNQNRKRRTPTQLGTTPPNAEAPASNYASISKIQLRVVETDRV